MLTEMTEYRHKIEEEVKAIQSVMRKNMQGTNSKGKETGTHISDLERNEEMNFQLEKNEKTRIQKNEERLRNLWDNFKHSNIWIIGVPEGEEEEQENEDLFEKIMKGIFPNLAKEIDIQVQQAQRIPNNLDPKRNTPRHIIIKLANIKDKERTVKAARGKELPTKEFP